MDEQLDKFYRRSPSLSNLEKYKKVDLKKPYWLTKDFFCWEPKLEPILSELYQQASDIFYEVIASEEDEEKAERIIDFKVGRIIIRKARDLGMKPKHLSYQMSNYSSNISTPICVWYTDDLGNIRYRLHSSLPSGTKE